jgi:uncharacterized protein (TIGR00661 family)
MGKRIAFFIGGTGLGNATRSIPVIEAALENKCEAVVATSSLSFNLIQQHFQSRLTLLRLNRLRLAGQNELNMLELVLRLPSLVYTFVANFFISRKLLRTSQAEVAYIDSEYSGLLAAKFAGCQIVVMNQGALVKRQWASASRQQKQRLWLSFYFLEWLEDFLYRMVAHKILVPTPTPVADLPIPYRLIAPPTRFTKVPAPNGGNEVLFIAGGSGMGDISYLEELAKVEPPIQIEVIGKIDQTLVASNVQFHGVVSHSEQYIESAKYIVAQGGHSSLMDLVFLGKPALLIPIAGHAEQHMNALWAEQQGFAIVCRRGDSVGEKFTEYRRRYSELEAKIKSFSFGNHGAHEALRHAELIELN